ncbi:MAG: hypothetical protein ACJ8GW_20670 [Massilia sp.]
MQPSLASVARYFRIGLELGICHPDQVRAWAISVIDQMAEPPGEIIEASWQKPLAQQISDLNDIKGEPDLELVCGYLLGTLASTMTPSDDTFLQALGLAMQVARALGFSELYDRLNGIDDGLALATSQTYGSVAEWRREFDIVLREYAIPPCF